MTVFQFDQEHVRQGVVPRVTDFQTCEYSTHMKVVGALLLADDGEVEALPQVVLGYADASAPRMVPATGMLSGGGAVTAHTPLWTLAHPHADTWVPVAGDPFNSGFAAEGEAGAAAGEWVIAPAGD